MDAVKLMIVIGQLEIGGTERHLLSILPTLSDGAIRPCVYVMRRGGALERDFDASGIRVIGPSHHSRRWLGLSRTSVHLLKTLRRERPDIVHFFLPEAYLLGGLCSLLGPSCRRIMSRRSLNPYQHRRPFVRQLERLLHGRMDCVLANSRVVLQELYDEGIARKKCGLIYSGISVGDTEYPCNRSDYGIGANTVVFIMVANIIPYKGHADVIDALFLAQDQLPRDWCVLMVGADAGAQPALATRAADAGIADHIRWFGRVDDPQPYYAMADIAINASHEEGFSNAVLEAMAASLAQVVTAVGGNCDAITHQESGIVVPPHDPAALADALVLLASKKSLREKLGRAARARVTARFSLEACTAAYRRLYLNLAQGTPIAIADLNGEQI